MSGRTKGRVILVKEPSEGVGGKWNDWELGGGWETRHVSILRTERDAGMVGELVELVGAVGRGRVEGLAGVVLTSGRAVESLQLAIDEVAADEAEPDSGATGWATLPFFVVGERTRSRLLAVVPRPGVFPDPRSLAILGHQDAGSGQKLARCIIAHFRALLPPPNRPLRLLHLTGALHDASLADSLHAHNQQDQPGCRFELITKIVYRIQPATEPLIFPPTDGVGEPAPEETERLRETLAQELESKRRGASASPGRATEGDDWMVFFSPNSARILLHNTNDLLLKTLRALPAPRLHLNHIHFAAIGPTTANFLTSVGLPPACVASSPSPHSLFRAISDSCLPPNSH